ncbi:hypothetical protein BS50DRAFT_655773 [Corynespora cassiicola Philippines]|uniref:Uncharacterized protein n=1 Tax=Corynespora cassiicola Philippines TaxID=1448308 RepID=A0A2T2N5A4_CORCC|nr:hypothetical protein BS50DRAFT_655773 [Corynespora cassiicola Philippines]
MANTNPRQLPRLDPLDTDIAQPQNDERRAGQPMNSVDARLLNSIYGIFDDEALRRHNTMVEGERNSAQLLAQEDRAELVQVLLRRVKRMFDNDIKMFNVRQEPLWKLHVYTLRAWGGKDERPDEDVEEEASQVLEDLRHLLDHKELTFIDKSQNPLAAPPWQSTMSRDEKIHWARFFVRMISLWRLPDRFLKRNFDDHMPPESDDDDYGQAYYEARDKEGNATPTNLEDSLTSLNVSAKYANEPGDHDEVEEEEEEEEEAVSPIEKNLVNPIEEDPVSPIEEDPVSPIDDKN